MRSLRVAIAAVVLGLLAGACGSQTKPASPIKIGVLSDCGGPFGGFYEVTLAGAELPLIARGGRLSGPNPSDGLERVSVAGRPLQLVCACGDGTTSSALVEARRLVEQHGVDVLIGPLAGEQEIAIQDYARRRPGIAFVNGSGSAQLLHPAPNFFSFHTDGAEWMAGLGSYAYHQLGWRRAVAVTDSTNIFEWAQTAGFEAEFCSLGGTIAKRVSVPPATSDYSAVVARVPRSGVDGVFVASSTDTVLALARAFPALGREAGRRLIVGTIAMLDSRIGQLGPGAGGLATGGIFYGNFERYVAAYRKAFPRTGAGVAGGPFDLFYYDAMAATLAALEAAHGDLSGGERRFMAALAKVELKAPNGHFKPDPSHQATGTNLVLQLQWPAQTLRVARTITNVEPTFGGYFGPNDPPPSETTPACKHGNPPPWAR
jgi:branched-chain amino acid transport system substrate-binding protein